jgi:glycolate oxidase iron-sulfur subunit
MLAVANGELQSTEKLDSHLSLCLMCRACEAVCPAHVPYGEVMDATRAQLGFHRKRSLAQRMALWAIPALTQRRWLRTTSVLLRAYQKSGLRTLLRRLRVLKLLGLAEIDNELPPSPKTLKLEPYYAAQTAKRGAVALFTGCIARLTDTESLHSAVHVLTHAGYDVHVPSEQTCCGALHQHEGDLNTARTMERRNIDAFSTLAIDAIVTTSSGCGATLAEYRDASRFSDKIVDVSTFLQNHGWPTNVGMRPLRKRVAIHDPCTLRNVQRSSKSPYDLLRAIPELEVVALPGNSHCCGAAGSYHLQHTAMARSLRDKKINAVRETTPQILATSNVGCSMFLAAGLRESGLSIDVVHPVTLLAGQLFIRDGRS